MDGSSSCLSGLSEPTAATNAPGRNCSRSRNGACEGVQVTQTSLMGTARARSSVDSISIPNSAESSSASARTRETSRSQAKAFSSLRTRERARSWMRPWFPQPQTVATLEFTCARCFAATAVAAPVRRTVISIESITCERLTVPAIGQEDDSLNGGQSESLSVGREVAVHLGGKVVPGQRKDGRSEEHTSELQSQSNLVCRLLLEKKKHT